MSRVSTRGQLALHSAAVRAYVDGGIAISTLRAYTSDLNHFKAWGGTIPCSPQLIASYIAAFAGTLKVSTLLRHAAAISHWHAAAGFQSPLKHPIIKATLRGVKRKHSSSQKQAKPLTVAMLKRLVQPVPQWSKLRNLRDRALLLIGFAGGFRRSELVALKTSDATFSRQGVILRLGASKTDPYGHGRDIALPFGDAALCPVRALRGWLNATQQLPDRSAESADTPLFRRIDRYGNPKGALCSAAVNWLLSKRLQAKGIDATGFSAHSLRAGLVTSAAKAGVPAWAIQRQTGHRSEYMVQRYIRDVGLFERNAVRSVL